MAHRQQRARGLDSFSGSFPESPWASPWGLMGVGFNGVGGLMGSGFNGVGPSEQIDFISKRLNFAPQNSLKHPFWGIKRAV